MSIIRTVYTMAKADSIICMIGSAGGGLMAGFISMHMYESFSVHTYYTVSLEEMA